MTKQEALKLLGGTVKSASEAIGCSYHAVNKWPDPLPKRIEDRVQAALWRQEQAKRRRSAKEQAAA